MKNIILLTIVLAVLLVFPGCNAGPFWGSAVLLDASDTHPLGANGRPAKIRGTVRWDFVRIHDNYGWATSNGRLSPYALGKRIEDFEPRPAPERLVGDFDGAAYAVRYPDTRTVVCIDPIVVLVTPEPLLIPGDSTHPDDLVGPLAVLKIGGVKPHIGSGYTASRFVPKSAELHWFSPSLRIGPTSVDLGVKPAEIKLGLGKALILEDDGQRWRVRMRRSGWSRGPGPATGQQCPPTVIPGPAMVAARPWIGCSQKRAARPASILRA